MTRTSCRAPGASSTNGGLIARSRVGSSVSSPSFWVQRNRRTWARTGLSGSVLLSQTASPFSDACSSTEVGATCRLAAIAGQHASRAARARIVQVFAMRRLMDSGVSVRDGRGDRVAVCAGTRVGDREPAVDLDVLWSAGVTVAVNAAAARITPRGTGRGGAGRRAGGAAVELVGDEFAACRGHPAIVHPAAVQARVEADAIGHPHVAAGGQRAGGVQLLADDHRHAAAGDGGTAG